MNNEEITIKRKNVEAAMNAADENMKKVLEKLFGIETHKVNDRPITERVKTFDDVVLELGEQHSYVQQLEYLEANRDFNNNKHLIAYHKLCMICEVLNEGWRPDYHKSEYRYYPWFYLYKSKEGEKRHKSQNEIIFEIPDSVLAVLVCDYAYAGAYDGFAYAYSNYAPSPAHTTISSRLCLKSKELVFHAIKYFSDIWLEYLFL